MRGREFIKGEEYMGSVMDLTQSHVADEVSSRQTPSGNSNGVSALPSRIFRAAMLDKRLFTEVAEDRAASVQALLVVILVISVSEVGSFFGTGSRGFGNIISQIFLGVFGWALWTSIIYSIGTKVSKVGTENAGWGGLARALGFAQAIGLTRLLTLVPGLAISVPLVTIVWIFVAMVVAVQQVLGVGSYLKTALVVALSALPYMAVMTFLNMLALNS